MRNTAVLVLIFVTLCWGNAMAQGNGHLELITDRSGASDACGPIAIRWGFMCPIAARYGDHAYALNFTRTPDVPWDTRTPIEAPLAFWSRGKDGKWSSVLLDAPSRTYQTPTLLLSPDGRANVFTLHPAEGMIQWFRAKDPSNTAFTRSEISMNWGSYMSGAIDSKGRAALVYWASGPDYSKSTLGCTLLDTTTGQSHNITVDSPGAPYCYNQVFFNDTGLHIFGIRSEVKNFQLVGSRNHYIDLRYYHCPDPFEKNPKWQHVVVMHNDRACIQPVGNLVDPSGRVHLLFWYELDNGHGQSSGVRKLVYAASREPATSNVAPEFVQHEIEGATDGRLFLTQDGAVHILTYATGPTIQYAQVLDPLAGKFSKWQSISPGVTVARIFPIDPRNGSTPSDDLNALIIPATNVPQKDSMFYFTWRPGEAK